MRVCMLVALLPTHVIGGMEIHSWDLAKGLSNAGVEVVIITTRHPDAVEKEVVDGIEIHYVDLHPTSKRPLGHKAIRKLEELHKVKPFDVVHSQSFSGFNYVKDGAKKRLGVPLVTTLHGTPRSEIISNINQGPSLMLIPKIMFHLLNQYTIAKRIVGESDAVIAISKELAENIPREFKINPKRVHTVYNGINTVTFKPAINKVRGAYSVGKLLLTVSVLHKQKGVQYLIEAMNEIVKKVPDTHLLIVGDGPYRKELENLADNLALREYVTFAGRKKNDELTEYYNAADAFVIPTIRVEGLPLIELEAMSCGLPVIASNIGGIPTVIDNGVNGILVKPGDVGELTTNIIDVLSDHKLASRLGGRARKTIEDGFSMEKMVAETISVYQSVLE